MKGIYLTIIGWFRNLFANKTDIGLVGGEMIRNTEKSIAAITARINQIKATGLGYEREVIELQNQVKDYKDSYKHHKENGDVALADKAKQRYEETYTKLNDKQALLDEVKANVKELEQQITELRNESSSAKNKIEKAAANQYTARTSSAIEDTFDELGNNGTLGQAINASQKQADLAQVRRDARKGGSDSDIMAYKKATAIPSIDD